MASSNTPTPAPEVRAVYDDIMATRKTDWINNFWKAIAHDPATAQAHLGETSSRSWLPGALDPLTKEMIYVAVSVTNQCEYCIASHTASAKNKGMTDAQFKELMAVVGMANETNRLVAGYQVEVDERFKPQTRHEMTVAARRLEHPGTVERSLARSTEVLQACDPSASTRSPIAICASDSGKR